MVLGNLHQLVPRLDALLMVLKTCKADTCRNPWAVLHPDGDVRNLTQALSSRYDDFYEVQQENRVQFKECLPGYLIENELPVKVLPYAADWL